MPGHGVREARLPPVVSEGAHNLGGLLGARCHPGGSHKNVADAVTWSTNLTLHMGQHQVVPCRLEVCAGGRRRHRVLSVIGDLWGSLQSGQQNIPVWLMWPPCFHPSLLQHLQVLCAAGGADEGAMLSIGGEFRWWLGCNHPVRRGSDVLVRSHATALYKGSSGAASAILYVHSMHRSLTHWRAMHALRVAISDLQAQAMETVRSLQQAAYASPTSLHSWNPLLFSR